MTTATVRWMRPSPAPGWIAVAATRAPSNVWAVRCSVSCPASPRWRFVTAWTTIATTPRPTGRKIQLPVYGACAEQQLAGRGGRDWRFGSAGYIAFGERQPFVPLAGRGRPFEQAVADGVGRLVAATNGIAQGEFPVRPDEPYLCTFCPYPSVCRKDYVGDE